MILTYYIIATSAAHALEQLTDSVPIPYYCGCDRNVALLNTRTLTSDDVKVRGFDCYTINLVAELTKW